MVYALAYSMHLTVNTFVRFKYFINLSEKTSVILGFFKGLIFIFLPSLLIQKSVFGTLHSPLMIAVMIVTLFISSLMIKAEKKNVKEEEITIKNGYMHTQIVLVLTILVYALQYLKVV